MPDRSSLILFSCHKYLPPLIHQLDSQTSTLHSLCFAQDQTPLIRRLRCPRASAETKGAFFDNPGKSSSIIAQSMFLLCEIDRMERVRYRCLERELHVDPVTSWELEETICNDSTDSGPYPIDILPLTKITIPLTANPFTPPSSMSSSPSYRQHHSAPPRPRFVYPLSCALYTTPSLPPTCHRHRTRPQLRSAIKYGTIAVVQVVLFKPVFPFFLCAEPLPT